MKFAKKINFLMLSMFFTMASTLTAQDNVLKENLTTEQTKLMEEQRHLIKANREAFKASLTPEQLAILKNAVLTKQERRDALVLTFTKAQKTLLQENKAKVNILKEQFKSTLTEEQRQQIRNRMKNRYGEDRNEIRESIKRDRIKKASKKR